MGATATIRRLTACFPAALLVLGALSPPAVGDNDPIITGSLEQWTDAICVMASLDASQLRHWLPRADDGGRCSSRPDIAGSYMPVFFGIYDSETDLGFDANIGSDRRGCCGTGPFAFGFTPDRQTSFLFVTNRTFPISGLRPLERFGFIAARR